LGTVSVRIRSVPAAANESRAFDDNGNVLLVKSDRPGVTLSAWNSPVSFFTGGLLIVNETGVGLPIDVADGHP